MPNIRTSPSIGSTQLGLGTNPSERAQSPQKQPNLISGQTKHVVDGTQATVDKRLQSASTATYAASAEESIRERTALSLKEVLEPRAKHPRYARGLLWDEDDDLLSSTAQWSLTAQPVPRVPEQEYLNLAALETITSHPELFLVDCRINVERFRTLLADHPNQPLVKSVCYSLQNGFWPYANTRHETYPTTWDFSDRPLKSTDHQSFIENQTATEVAAGRYSGPFGPGLYPGMYTSPTHAVPKPGTDTYRLINDQSAGDFSPNSMIDRDDVAGTCMDGIKSLGASLRAFRREFGDDVELLMWKSDIQGAYRNMWMHPMWQIKQVVTVDNKHFVDHCNCFGNRASYIIWLSFASLVAWIALYVKRIQNLKVYIDDNASYSHVGDVLYYDPYKRYYPTEQTKLLLLWDELNIPHEERKQIYGPVVPFIGFDVDPNAMTISISTDRIMELVQRIRDFARAGKRRSLKDFESIAGYINWSLAVFPLLKPCLSALYAKIVGKTQQMAPVHVNTAICNELLWFVKHAVDSSSIFLLKTVAWDSTSDLSNATICYADALLRGMAYWFPELKLAFQC
jgi:hypothetical protein